MDELKYKTKKEIMTLPTYQRKRNLKKLKNYKKRVRKHMEKERKKLEGGKNKW